MDCIDDTRRALEIMASYGQHGKAPTSAFQARSDPAAPALLAAGPKVAMAATTAMPGPAGPVRLRVYRAVEDGRPRPALVYLHCGGCVVGNLDSHDRFCRALANGTGHAVVAVDFRPAPEYPFPAAVEDCHAAVQFVAAHCLSFRIIPGRLSIAGDGTGGSLAAAVCRLAREQGPALVHQVLLVPLTQWAQDTPSRRELAESTFPSAARSSQAKRGEHMTISWAYIFEHPGTDPVADRMVIDRNGQRTFLVPVPSPADAPRVAQRLIAEDDVTLIELCGGFALADAARVAEALGGKVPVGHVAFAVDSVPAAAAYNAAFEATQGQ